MGRTLLISLAALAVGGCASVSGNPMAARLDAPAYLGVAAIDREDWALAEKQLNAAPVEQWEDPARLVNLGKVYMATNRPGLALATWERALKSRSHYDVRLKDGSTASTAEVAHTALDRYRYASR